MKKKQYKTKLRLTDGTRSINATFHNKNKVDHDKLDVFMVIKLLGWKLIYPEIYIYFRNYEDRGQTYNSIWDSTPTNYAGMWGQKINDIAYDMADCKFFLTQGYIKDTYKMNGSTRPMVNPFYSTTNIKLKIVQVAKTTTTRYQLFLTTPALLTDGKNFITADFVTSDMHANKDKHYPLTKCPIVEFDGSYVLMRLNQPIVVISKWQIIAQTQPKLPMQIGN